MKSKISIIVPIYNAQETIKRCISSLVQQTYSNIEIILVNDGSRDNSLSICQEFASADSRIILIDKKNGGVSSARNLGIGMASGEFIMFCDSDDWVKPDYCKDMLRYYSVNNLLMCEIEKRTKDGENVIDQQSAQNDYIEKISKSKFLEYKDKGLALPTNKIFKKSIVVNNKLRFPEQLFLGEDFAFVLSYLKCISGDIDYLHKKLYMYQEDSENSLSKKAPKCQQNELFYEILTDAIISLKAEESKNFQLRNKIIMYDFEKTLVALAQQNSLSFTKKYKEAKKIVNTKAYKVCCKAGVGSSNLIYEWLYKSGKAGLLMMYLYFAKRLRRRNE